MQGIKKIIAAIFLILLICSTVFFAKKYFTNVETCLFIFENTSEKLSTKKMDTKFVDGKSFKNFTSTYFTFSDQIQNLILNFFSEHKNASFELFLKSLHDKENAESGTEQSEVFYGFLYPNDFIGGKLKSQISDRPLIRVNMNDFPLVKISLSLLKGTSDFPCAFFTISKNTVEHISISLTSAKLGWDISNEVPIFAFAANGGEVTAPLNSADFSSASLLFPVQTGSENIMPKITCTFSPILNEEKPPASFSVFVGQEELKVYHKNEQNFFTIQSAALLNPFSNFSLRLSDAKITSIMMIENENALSILENGNPLYPIKADPGLVLKWNQKNWRCNDYELFEWESFPNVLLFDLQNYSIQNVFFKRLAFYVEKAGYKGKLLSDSFLSDKHAYNAHDYSSESLASFFSKAKEENFPLNEKEKLLRTILLANKIIVEEENLYKAGKGAIISISRESTNYLRRRLLAHEGWHGIFFTDEKFRNVVASIFYTMDENARNFLLGYWQSQATLNYDIDDSFLVQNEFMAYIMQQGVSEIANYYVTRATWNSVNQKIPELAMYVRNTNGAAFEDVALIFDDYAKDTWNLECGRVWLIE